MFIPNCFTRPDVLKTIEIPGLLRLLRPYEKYLKSRDFYFPAIAHEEPDYRQLALILVNSDGETPPDLLETLHVIGNVGVEERVEQLLDLAHLHSINTGNGKITAIDLAVRVWVNAPMELSKMEHDEFLQKEFKFEYFSTAKAATDDLARKQMTDFSNLEERLDDWLIDHKRGPGSVVQCAVSGSELRFTVDHGLTSKRDRDRRGRLSYPLYFRPEKTDLVILDLVQHELRVHASTVGEIKLYVREFGRHLFDDPGYFAFKKKYTLEPLRVSGLNALACKGIEGMESALLREINWTCGGAFGHKVKHRASDLFLAFAVKDMGIPPEVILKKAVIEVKLTGVGKSRCFSIWPPKTSHFTRGEEIPLIEQWLRRQGFILLGRKTASETIEQPVARS